MTKKMCALGKMFSLYSNLSDTSDLSQLLIDLSYFINHFVITLPLSDNLCICSISTHFEYHFSLHSCHKIQTHMKIICYLNNPKKTKTVLKTFIGQVMVNCEQLLEK